LTRKPLIRRCGLNIRRVTDRHMCFAVEGMRLELRKLAESAEMLPEKSRLPSWGMGC
jgi:hypothetical protein